MLHREEGAAIEFTDFVDSDYVGMIQFGGGLSFALETRPAVSVLAEMRGKKLERDLAIKFGVLGKVDLAHPTGTDLLDDPVVIDDHTLGEHRHYFCFVVVGFAVHYCLPSRRQM
jgi:hypothetical protein